MINQEYDKRILAWISENKERMVSMWLDLVRIPSVESGPAPGAPFGIPCAQALKKAADYAQQVGLQTRLEAERGYSLAWYGQSSKTIGLFGHSDVVPAGDGWLYTEPFEPIIKDGIAIGRGCGDNKSGVMASLFAAQIIKECQLPIKSRLQLFVGSNEESGMADIQAFAANETMPDLCLVPDARYPCSLGEKGILRQWTKCNAPMEDILDFKGGCAFNVVLDYVEVTLKYTAERMAELALMVSGNPAYTVAQAADGTILLTATGASKHAASPEGSVNATVLAAKLLAECATISDTDRAQMKTIVDFLEDYYGGGLGISFEEEGFGKLSCANGMVKVEDGHLCISLDIRYGTGMDPKKLETLLDAAWDKAGWLLTYRVNEPGFKVDSSSPIPGLLTQVAQEVTGADFQPYWMSGGTYSRYLKNAYTVGASAVDASSTAVVPEMPAGHGGAHQRDEYCVVDEFLQGVRLLTHCILACDQVLNA